MVFPSVLGGVNPLVLGQSLLLKHDFPGVSMESSRCLPYLFKLSGLKHQIVSSRRSAAKTLWLDLFYLLFSTGLLRDAHKHEKFRGHPKNMNINLVGAYV